MANTVGPLIKEARTKAKLSQESLSSQIDGLSASDLGKAERGEKELSQSVLRQIAKITGVTQSSLVNAAKESTYGTAKKTTSAPAAKKTSTASATKKTSTASTSKKTSAASTSKKTNSASAKKAGSSNAVELTAAEKKLVELYRAADSETRKKAVAVLKGEQSDSSDILTALLGNAIDMFGKK